MYGYPGQGHGPGGYQGGPPPPQGYGYQGGPPPPQGYGYQGGPPPPGPRPGDYGSPPPPQPGYYPPGGQPQYQQQYGGPPPQQHHQQHYGNQPQYAPPQHAPPQGYDNYGYPHGGQGQGQGQGPYRTGPPPPTGQQQFGHGAPPGYTFQYSACTGRRKALLIGINYFRQQGELRGCINDTKNVSAFLIERYGYKREDMVILTDDQPMGPLHPTRDNILRAMGWLVKDAQPNDSLFLHYSGHGGQTKDLDGDEDDGYDEVIYPVDFRATSHIVDDQIHEIVVRPLKPGVRLTAIFDSCHSGSVLDLPYLYSTKGVLKEPNLAKEAGQGLLSALSAYSSGDMRGVTSSLMGLAKKAMGGNDGYQKTMRTKTSPADVIMWSGSKDDQTSADATIASQATGAMSWAFITALKQNPNQTYLQLLNSIRDVLATKYSQKPQLSCSHPLDVNLPFVM